MHKIHLNRNSTLLNNYQQISQAHNYETRQSLDLVLSWENAK